MEKLDVNVFDDTFQATLTLWNRLCPSASAWKPSHTLLLITNAAFRSEGKLTVTITATTQVEVDPEMRDAEWLRGFAQRLTKREHVNQPFPDDGPVLPSLLFAQDANSLLVFDIEVATSTENRILFTLADIDEL